MRRHIITFVALLITAFATAQTTQNSWIDYTQTYYKFSVAEEGIYRIPQSTLDAAGLGNTQAQDFQLWRNGEEQPIYVSKTSGELGSTDFIEFYGIPNDGKLDTKLYAQPEDQMSDHYSLFSDTATYFLTVHTTGNNLRYTDATNDVAGNSLSPEPYFMYQTGVYFKTQINGGANSSAGGIRLYSSAFDIGEGFISNNIAGGGSRQNDVTNLSLYPQGPDGTISYTVVGLTDGTHEVSLSLEGTVLDNTSFSNYNIQKRELTLPTSALTNAGRARVVVKNTVSQSTNRIGVAKWEITYPRKFEFTNASHFSFDLETPSSGKYLEITKFSSGNQEPILYDVSNLKRYKGNIEQSGMVRFALPASQSATNNFHLGSVADDALTIVAHIQPQQFVDYSKEINQGDYIIISNPALYSSSDGKNYVEAYRDYRATKEGGQFKAIIIDINQLKDQYAYGIQGHPVAIKEFIQYAANHFTIKPKFVFIVAKGITYTEVNSKSGNPNIEKLNLVPTFGNPASDILLSTPYKNSLVPLIPIGRIPAVNGDEVSNYLDKVKEYESVQNQTTTAELNEELWKKNIMQVVGGQDDSENSLFRSLMNGYKTILEAPKMGGHTELFSKTSNASVQLANSKRLVEMLEGGVSLISYFGHSSATKLDYDLSDPNVYNNQGRYPMFIVSGCIVGNNFILSEKRLNSGVTEGTVSENYVLSPKKGSIGFMASTHYGIVSQLNNYNTAFYKHLSNNYYGAPVGVLMQKTNETLSANSNLSYFGKIDLEQMNLNGDPAIKINAKPKPDYVIDESSILIDPSFVSVSNQSFKVNIKAYNIGQATSDSVIWEVKRRLPDGSESVIHRVKRLAPYYTDSISITVPIVTTTDKGGNKITVTIDADNDVEEMSESNNSFTKDVFIFENEATPIYPAPYAIINKDDQKLYASTADPLIEDRDYVFQIDTSSLFQSPIKISQKIRSKGGILEFDPGIKYLDSTVYYWRVMVQSDTTTEENAHWNESSFIYLKNSSLGSNQSHYFQHLNSEATSIRMNESRIWTFDSLESIIHSKAGVFPTAFSLGTEYQVDINGAPFTSSVCGVSGIVFNVLDPKTLKPWLNSMDAARFGSDAPCGTDRLANFQFNILDQQKRVAAYHFLKDSVPDGYIVVVRNISGTGVTSNTYAEDWKADESVLGQGNSLYHVLKDNGFATIDSFNRPRAFTFIYQKNNEDFIPEFAFSEGTTDMVEISHSITSTDSIGYIQSPAFGPAAKWQDIHWRGHELNDNNTATASVEVIGIDHHNQQNVLLTLGKQDQDASLGFIDAAQYPYIKLSMRNADSTNFDPYQLDYWRINYEPVPEGALAPRLKFESSDSLSRGELLKFKIAFKNISGQDFDSLKIKVNIINSKNETQVIPIPRQKALISGDTVILSLEVDTKGLLGKNTLYVDFNPDDDQPELFHFNNFLYHEFFVKEDNFNPILDVTFDGVHILNRDIVSAKPHIAIKLTDDNRSIQLSDTSLIKVQLKYTNDDGTSTLRTIPFDNDTLRLIPSTEKGGEALIEYRPVFDTDDAEYELVVSGKDASGNASGAYDYRVTFRVIGEAMITEMLNYPNPFTTSTAFVFTLTGSEVPQNLRIQILTITGKIVREITKEELGPLHIGRNITEFKWDGTDMYGQPLANGVYLYRVLTNLNGQSLRKFKGEGYNIDPKGKFFKSGYGKMYLMR